LDFVVAMKKIFLFLLMASLSLFLLRCSKVNPPAKQQSAAHVQEPAAQAPEEEEPEKPEIKAATPEDPGPIVTVVGPLAEWTKNQKPTSAKSGSAGPEHFVSREPQKIDHIALAQGAKSRNFLHSVFTVNTSAQFVFEVPPHTLNPRLNGTFKSYTDRSAPDSSSNETANIDVMLLNEQEYDDFKRGRLGNATYDLDASHYQNVGWRVPSTLENAQKYHLVFSNLPGGAKTKFVKADFTISFE
jgi:hypothetical protein